MKELRREVAVPPITDQQRAAAERVLRQHDALDLLDMLFGDLNPQHNKIASGL